MAKYVHTHAHVHTCTGEQRTLPTVARSLLPSVARRFAASLVSGARVHLACGWVKARHAAAVGATLSSQHASAHIHTHAHSFTHHAA